MNSQHSSTDALAGRHRPSCRRRLIPPPEGAARLPAQSPHDRGDDSPSPVNRTPEPSTASVLAGHTRRAARHAFWRFAPETTRPATGSSFPPPAFLNMTDVTRSPPRGAGDPVSAPARLAAGVLWRLSIARRIAVSPSVSGPARSDHVSATSPTRRTLIEGPSRADFVVDEASSSSTSRNFSSELAVAWGGDRAGHQRAWRVRYRRVRWRWTLSGQRDPPLG